METVLEVRDFGVHYLTRFGERIEAVNAVDCRLSKGETLGVAGESGCGKSTLVSGIMGLFTPPLFYTRGSVVVDGIDIMSLSLEERRRDILGKKISMIPQSALNSLNPTRTIGAYAYDMMHRHFPEMKKNEVSDRLRERFRHIGLPERVLRAWPLELSGGMKQRAVIGISTLMNPSVVIADEPTSALDVSTQKSVIRLLLDLLAEGIFGSMIFITHELPLLYHVADTIAIMYAGEFVETGKQSDVISAPMHPYSKSLMESMLLPEEGCRDKKPAALPGAPPRLSVLPQGCRFAPRCPSIREEICPAAVQQMHTVGVRKVRCQYVA
jgi:peptide/nickel transport system ATP-binding protein